MVEWKSEEQIPMVRYQRYMEDSSLHVLAQHDKDGAHVNLSVLQ